MTRFIKKRTDKENKPPINAKKASKQICSYHKCKKEAVGRYTVDLDVNGLNYCKNHKSGIQSAILWTVLGVEEMAQKAMGVEKIANRKSAKKL